MVEIRARSGGRKLPVLVYGSERSSCAWQRIDKEQGKSRKSPSLNCPEVSCFSSEIYANVFGNVKTTLIIG
jgi:hypothetical protein